MVRQYIQVTDEQRSELVRLIHREKYSIARASKTTGIPYDNAKAINRTYLKEERIRKINYTQRYQTRKKNYGRKRNHPLNGNVNGASRRNASAVAGHQGHRAGIITIDNSAIDSDGPFDCGQPKKISLEKQTEFMRQMGLQDVDMNELDEEDSSRSKSNDQPMTDQERKPQTLQLKQYQGNTIINGCDCPKESDQNQVNSHKTLIKEDIQNRLNKFQNTDQLRLILANQKFKRLQVMTEKDSQRQSTLSQDKTPEFKMLQLKSNTSVVNDEITRRDSHDVSPNNQEQGNSNKSMQNTPDNFQAAYKKLVQKAPVLVDSKFGDSISERQIDLEGSSSYKVRIPKFVHQKDAMSETSKIPPILQSIKNQCMNRTPQIIKSPVTDSTPNSKPIDIHQILRKIKNSQKANLNSPSESSSNSMRSGFTSHLPTQHLQVPVKQFYPSPKMIKDEYPLNKMTNSILLQKLSKLKQCTHKASQVVLDKIDKKDPSKYVIVNVECIEELIRNQHQLIDIMQESLQKQSIQ